jgi:alkylhydroperoxidase/carboxymuconolactone decarboxylase family protein YurZ
LAKLKKELSEIEALMPKVADLEASFKQFRNTQLKINLNNLQDVTRLRARLANEIDSRLASHSCDITSLTHRYNTLYTVAMSLITQRVADIRQAADPALQLVTHAKSNLVNGANPPPYISQSLFKFTNFPPHKKQNQLPPIRKVLAM